MLAGIRDILIITTPEDQEIFQKLLGDGKDWGINLSYQIQPEPKGLAQALLIGEDHIAGEKCALILGDNIFYGHGLPEMLQEAAQLDEGCIVFGSRVHDPERYGVVSLMRPGKQFLLRKSLPSQNQTMRSPACISTTKRQPRRPAGSNLPIAVSWK